MPGEPALTTARDPARLFLALWPDEATRRALQAWQAAVRWPPEARPTAPAHLHLTLHFIGAVPRDRLPALADALGAEAGAFEACTLRLDGFAVWPRGIALLQPGRTEPALARLHAALGAALAAQGLPVETRPYRPHVTLARHAAGAVLREGAPPPPVPWPVREGFVLAESAGGYRVLRRWGGPGVPRP
ncbi:MAG: RNA 2',3'-cyclic phosphodiesterase [Burkholderiaceae bacterium]